MAARPPDGLPTYRLLTGPDDDAFCRRVSEALARGYRLWGSPAMTFDGTRVIAAQAVLWSDGGQAPQLEAPRTDPIPDR